MNFLFKYWEILILLILAAFILSRGINKPFYGHHDWNSVQYGNMARNFVRYGIFKTKFGQAENSGPTDNDFAYNTHHPSLLPILTSLSFKIFGIHEFSARLVPISFSLFTIIGLYLLGRLLYSRMIGFWLAAFAAVTPMFIYFGKMLTHEPLILCWSVWSIYWYTLWIKSKRNKYFSLLLVTTFLNGITGWPGYFLYPIITLITPEVLSLTPRGWNRKFWKKTLWLWLILLTTFGLHLAHTFILTGSITGGGLVEILLKRLNQEVDPVQAAIIGFSWKKYLVQEARWLIVYFTRPLAVAGLLVLLIFLAKIRLWRTPRSDLFELSESIIFLGFLFALSYPLVFSNAVFIHDYLNIYFLPFFVLSIGWILNKLSSIFSPKLIFLFSLLLFVLIGTERRDFVKALQGSNMHKIGYDLGLAVKEKTNFDEAVIVSAPQFAAHFSKFAYFYADRKIDFWERDVVDFEKQKEQLKKKFKFLITIDSMPVKEDLRQEFDKIGKERVREFTFYKLAISY